MISAHSICRSLLLLSIFYFVNATHLLAQNIPSVKWQESLGGTNDDLLHSACQTADSGYILAGETFSNNGNVSGNHGGLDYWVVRLDKNGNLLWQKCLGGTGFDRAYSIIQSKDGGYAVAGQGSSNGDITGNHGFSDYWVAKLDQNGNIQWQKSLGGSDNDFPSRIIQTHDGNYVIAGNSWSHNGDVTGSKGVEDCWIVKLDSSGNLLWQKSYGGTDIESASSIIELADGKLMVAAYTASKDGDITSWHGYEDYWIFQLDSVGNLLWQKSFGGSKSDWAIDIRSTIDGGFIVAGISSSIDGDVTGHHGYDDYWIIKLDSIGNLVWEKSLGGSEFDQAMSVVQTSDRNYLVAGWSTSMDGDVTDSQGEDAWIVDLDSLGNIRWQNTYGGAYSDRAECISETFDGSLIASGWSYSSDGDASSNNGAADFWILNLSDKVCNTPINPNVTNITSTSALLNWNSMTGAMKYKVRYKLLGNSWTTTTVSGTSYQVNGLNPHSKYSFSVRSVCNSHPKLLSAWSYNVKFSTLPFRLEEVLHNDPIIGIYPDPVTNSSVVTIKIDGLRQVTIQLFNEEGKFLGTVAQSTLDSGTFEFALHAELLNSGINFVKIITGNNVTWKKVIKLN